MANSYDQFLRAGQTPNQAALSAQLGAGGQSRSIFDPPPGAAPLPTPSAPSPVASPNAPGGRLGNQPLGAGVGGPAAPAAPAASPSAPGSPFQSNNMSVGGYLQDAMRSQLPAIQAIGSEEERKRFAENFIRSLVPEIERRGGRVGDIRNEKIQIDGQWRDLVQDISGSAANAQYIIPDEGGPAAAGGGAPMMPMMGGMGGTGLASQLQGNPLASINAALSQINSGGQANLQALIAQLQGGGGR